MDYKQKYEQTIENIKKIKSANKDNKALVDFIEYEYPELNQSDDLKIKSDIQYAVRCAYGDNNNKTKDILAWLEKQGEKIDTIENFDTEFEKQVSCLIASVINREHEYNQGYVKWTANALLEYAKHELEKQGEQKPAWSEEDERLFQIIIDILDRENHLGNITHTDLIACVRKLKSLKPQPHWKPTKEQLENLLNACNRAYLTEGQLQSLRELREQLKSL